MQRTLFTCGVKKNESSGGRVYDVTSSMPLFVKNDVKVELKCDACKQEFKSKQYLELHISWNHKDKQTIAIDEVNGKSYSGLQSSIDSYEANFHFNIASPGAAEVGKGHFDLENSKAITHKPTESGQATVSNRRGRGTRKSYTTEFKA